MTRETLIYASTILIKTLSTVLMFWFEKHSVNASTILIKTALINWNVFEKRVTVYLHQQTISWTLLKFKLLLDRESVVLLLIMLLFEKNCSNFCGILWASDVLSTCVIFWWCCFLNLVVSDTKTLVPFHNFLWINSTISKEKVEQLLWV